MKRLSAGLIMSLLAMTSFAQNGKPMNTLLWKVTGNGLEKPSYLFGTIHMLCKEDAFLGAKLVEAIEKSDKVYLELDMDNLFEMLGAMSKMKMRGDTTLADLVSKEEYQQIKAYFAEKNSMLPFSMVETYKPMIASSLLMEANFSACEEQVAMEQLIMDEAKKKGKTVLGLETMAYQMSIFDSIPYKIQAQDLLKSINAGNKDTDGDKEFKEMMDAYREQNLDKLGALITSEEEGMMQYQDILLNNRNLNWVEKLKTIMPQQAVVVAVGAGHLPGEKGVINLLRKAGYTVTPVENKMSKPVKEI
ncbi:MAG: TraB/GumN family protein [Bacteroidetes bacterium]|nr:TraB/GumN family protein [Bacteroidota bacterium]